MLITSKGRALAGGVWSVGGLPPSWPPVRFAGATDYALAEVPAELIAPGPGLDLSQLGAGIVFASGASHVQELSVTTRALVGAGAVSGCAGV